MIIAIEGLPGSEKTTTAKLVADRAGASAVCETTGDHPFLEAIYDDEVRFDLQIELGFLLLHSRHYRGIASDVTTVIDFSPAKDLLFADLMLDGDDHRVFEAVYERLYVGLQPPGVVVFLAASPQLCYSRTRERLRRDPDRSYEEGLTLERLRLLEEVYEKRQRDLGKVVHRLDVTDGQSRDEVANGVSDLIECQLT